MASFQGFIDDQLNPDYRNKLRETTVCAMLALCYFRGAQETFSMLGVGKASQLEDTLQSFCVGILGVPKEKVEDYSAACLRLMEKYELLHQAWEMGRVAAYYYANRDARLMRSGVTHIVDKYQSVSMNELDVAGVRDIALKKQKKRRATWSMQRKTAQLIKVLLFLLIFIGAVVLLNLYLLDLI